MPASDKGLSERSVFVVVNPRAGGGRAGGAWPELSRRLAARLGRFESALTDCRGDATGIVRQAVARGARLVVAVGGDGTLNEAINGLALEDGGLVPDVQIAAIPAGTGSDFARTLAPGGDADAAIAAIAEGGIRKIDLGRAAFRASDGGLRRRLFANVASFGLSGVIDRMVENGPKRLLPGKAVFLLAALRAVTTFPFQRVRLTFDDAEMLETEVALVAVANGRFFGGGMKIAPDAEPDDGMMDVVVLSRTARATLLKDLPLVYRGAHRDHPAITIRRARRLRAELLEGPANGAAQLVDMDGETPGSLPVDFEILPRALTLRG